MLNRMRAALFFLMLSLPVRAASPAAQTAAPAAAPAPSNDMIILDQEAKFQTEKTQYLQQNILDKILGPGKAVVIVDVEMGLEAKNMTMDMDKSKTNKKKNDNDDDKGPAPAARVLVPGVPMPKSVIPEQEDRGGQSQQSGGQMESKHMEVHTTIKKLLVTVLYDKKVPADKLLAVKQAIIAVMKVTEAQMVFTPTVFTETVWQEVISPKWLIPLFFALWLMFFLWGPLRSFFKRLNAALEDKTQKIEQLQKIEQEEQSEEQA